MNRRFGFAIQTLAILVAIGGLIPAALFLYSYNAHYQARDQMSDIYFGTDLMKYALIALPGFALAYLLFRLGRRLTTRVP